MGYSVHFKEASLRQIFAMKARKYTADCRQKVSEVIGRETPGLVLAQIEGRPQTWVLGGQLTDSVKEELMKLPFVDKVQTDDEARAQIHQPKSLKDKLRYLVQGFIY